MSSKTQIERAFHLITEGGKVVRNCSHACWPTHLLRTHCSVYVNTVRNTMTETVDKKVQHLIKVRTITYFVPAKCSSAQEWTTELQHATEFLKRSQSLFESRGRIVSRDSCH
jgi:hypothetical protein